MGLNDKKISDLNELTQGNINVADEFEVLDKSDTTMASTGTNKRFSWASVKGALQTFFDTLYASLTDFNNHTSNESDGVHGSTSAATASKLVHRDAAGRAKMVAPSAATDIAIKSTADGQPGGVTAGTINALTGKTTPIGADLALIEDSAASNAKKKATLANIVSNVWNALISQFNSLTEETDPADADLFVMERATDGAKRKVQASNLSGGGGGATTAYKTQDQDVTGTTFEDDDDLLFPVEIGDVWSFQFFLITNMDVNSDMKFILDAPAGASGHISVDEYVIGAEAALDVQAQLLEDEFTLPENVSGYIMKVTGIVNNPSSAGNLKLRFAQQSASGGDCTIEENSYVIAHKLSS